MAKPYSICAQAAVTCSACVRFYFREVIDGFDFLLTDVAEYLEEAKSKLIDARDLLAHPHYTESYYMLATELNG